MSKELALFCILHPATSEKKDRVLSLLDGAKPYYQSSQAKCTTWSYFTPSKTIKVLSNMIPDADKQCVIAGMEIYTDKSALPTQTESSMFQDFHAKVKAEQLYAKDEELVAWYPVGGFVSRGETARPFGGGVLVLIGKITCKTGQRDRLVELMRTYAEWVKQNEPGFLTYSIMVRPKASDEMLVFERCTGPDAFQNHVTSKPFKEAMAAAGRYIKSGRGQEWTELDNAFVGNVLGGVEGVTQAKL